MATNKVIGKALYLELVVKEEENSTTQVIVFPQYLDHTGTLYESVVLSRQVSQYTPKRQWHKTINRTRVKPDEVMSEGWYAETYTKEEWDKLTGREQYESRKVALDITLRNLLLHTRRSYDPKTSDYKAEVIQLLTLRDKKPFSVEITEQDLIELNHQHKTPQAVIRRINKVRESLDEYPEALYSSK